MIKRAFALLNPYKVFRSSITGRFVSRLHALANPRTTYATQRERA